MAYFSFKMVIAKEAKQICCWIQSTRGIWICSLKAAVHGCGTCVMAVLDPQGGYSMKMMVFCLKQSK